jgi:hypothetical protein
MLKPSDTTQTITLKELLLEKLLVPKCYYNPDSACFCIGIQTNPHDNFPKCVGCKIGIWLHHFSLSTNNSKQFEDDSNVPELEAEKSIIEKK